MNRRRTTHASVSPKPEESLRHGGVNLPPIFRTKVKASRLSPTARAFPDKRQTSPGISLIHVLIICLSLLVAAGGLIYHLHIRFEGVRLGYQASEQRKKQTQLMLQRRELRLELASMKEPGRIEDEAREKLGMETPKSDEFVHINKKKKVVSVSGGAL